MVSINTGSKAKDFADTLLFYTAGAIADTLIPFTSAGMTIAQFLVSNYGSLSASMGDKTSQNDQYDRIVEYNKKLSSLHYSSPDSTALSCYGSGGYLDEHITMMLGRREFMFL